MMAIANRPRLLDGGRGGRANSLEFGCATVELKVGSFLRKPSLEEM
jgi:hypothetical protein